MNILLTDDSLPVGGKETLLLNYLKRLDRERFKVHFLTLTSKGELIDEAKEYADHYFCAGRKVAIDFGAIWRSRKYVKAHEIQLVHTNQWIDSLYLYIATVGLPVKRVSTIHGIISGWRSWVQKIILRQFDQVISVSNSSREDLISRGYSGHKLVVIYNGIDMREFRGVRRSLDSKLPLVIGMVGSFRKERDHLTLCRAVHHLVQTGKKRMEVRLIGRVLDPECEMETKRYCSENGLDSYVRFLGPRRDIPEQLSQLDVFVASSRSETFGLALVEAMACGLPVIASDIPAFMEIIENGKYGLYFQTGDHVPLADRIVELMEDTSLRYRYAELAYRRAQHFSIDSSIEQLQSLYEDISNS